MELASTSDSWSEADALFTAALGMDPLARAEFLQRETAGRPELRREIEGLLEAAAAADSCFERLPGAIGATLDEYISARTGTAAGDDGGPDEQPGRRIGRYRVVRRLARGGMGTVYLAERADGAFERRVALKLLRRGLDTDDILDRFRAERQILADLEHPNIARLIDGGSSEEGRPFLVVEYVEGEPITDYCERHELDLPARLRLFLAVCDAVHHAHDQGVIHRDLKPANILVDGDGRAKLLDFGIARLLGADDERVHTRPGTRLMTREYASPEQVRGESVDASSDVYQLGLLLYEMLSGARAHRVDGRSPAELERAVCHELAPRPSARAPEPRRKRLRGDLDAIALRALQKRPGDRYASAAALGLDIRRFLDGRPVTARADIRGYRLRHLARRHAVKAALAAGAAAIVLLAAGVLPGVGTPPVPAARPGTVAVLPFRVSGADASLAYLREGMVDLLSTKLTGEGGPRAIAPATVLDAWREAGGSERRDVAQPGALAVARGVSAAELLVGEVVGTPERLILNASLLDGATGEVAVRTAVEGPADSLLSLVDELTARLLLLGAEGDAPPPGAGDLVTASLPALRAYLEGRAHFRAARYADAFERFSEAIEHDSTFAVAAVQAWQAAWFSQRPGDARLLHLAWQGRERLSARDRRFVNVMLGPDYPAPYSQAERLAGRRALVDAWPDRAEVRYLYADNVYHWHAVLGLSDGKARAAAQLRRALESDSTYAPTYQHLVPLLYVLGEETEAERTARAYLRREADGAIRSFLAWRMAAARHDTATLVGIRQAMDALSDEDLLLIYRTAVQDGVDLPGAERAIDELGRRGLTPALRERVERERFIFELLRGRPGAAVAAAERLGETQRHDPGWPRLEANGALVLTALYGDGEEAAAREGLARLEVAAYEAGDIPSPEARLTDLCTVAQWRLWNDPFPGAVDAAIERLRSADGREPLKSTGHVCALLLEAIDAALNQRPDADARLARLDSALVTGPHGRFTDLAIPANLAAARLHERRGDSARALAAVRRRVYDMDSSNLLLASSLRMEGRLAAAAGDTAGAIAAYEHYLVLRSDPEPALRAQADSVRAALAALRDVD